MFNVNISVTSKTLRFKQRTLINKVSMYKKRKINFSVITSDTNYYFLFLMSGASGSFTFASAILGLKINFNVVKIV